VAEERISEVTSRVSAVAEGVSSKAGQQWDKLESIFEERVAKAMNKLGVPARKDVDALIGRIDALSAQVAKLSPAAKPRKAAAKAVNGAAKPAAKRASAARKSA
jgi:poly(hydroxyalkanoate) granule-associated protein